MIRTEGLTRVFGDLTAVDRLSLEVAPGEVLGFLGPNGAGKTTTVRMLAALIAPTKGTAIVAGHDVTKEPMAVRRKVGILTETPGLYERLTARKNLEIFAKLYEVEDVDGQVDKYLKLVDLWDRRDDPAGSFSKGMRQRLAIGRALLHEPELVFLDEPTSALDPQSARNIRDFVLDLKGQGRTFFVCTHNLDEAERLCDRVALFQHRLLVVDTPENLRDTLYGRQVQFALAQVDDAHVAAVSALEFVDEVHADADGLRIRLGDPASQNPIVIRALVEAGAQLQYVTEVKQSMEQVYLDLLKQAET